MTFKQDAPGAGLLPAEKVRKHSRLPIAAWMLAYIFFMAAIVGGLLYGRQQALAIYGSAEALAQWETWREDAAEMAKGPGPVKRRVPKSPRPPALVLMTDHFAVCLGLAVVLSTVLFGTFMFFVRGAMKSGPETGRG